MAQLEATASTPSLPTAIVSKRSQQIQVNLHPRQRLLLIGSEAPAKASLPAEGVAGDSTGVLRAWPTECCPGGVPALGSVLMSRPYEINGWDTADF